MAENENAKTQEQAQEQTTTETATEEKSTAELQAEIQRLNDALKKQKAATDNASADASKYKKELNARLTAEEQKAAENEAKLTRLAELERKEITNKYRDKFVENGFDNESAKKMAEFLPDNVSDDFFVNQKNFMDAWKQSERTKALTSAPDLSSGIPPTKQTIDDEENAKLRHYFGL